MTICILSCVDGTFSSTKMHNLMLWYLKKLLVLLWVWISAICVARLASLVYSISGKPHWNSAGNHLFHILIFHAFPLSLYHSQISPLKQRIKFYICVYISFRLDSFKHTAPTCVSMWKLLWHENDVTDTCRYFTHIFISHLVLYI
jgi:hypothetical protein